MGGKRISKEKQGRLLNDTQDRYEAGLDPLFAAARLWIDGYTDPAETRGIISRGIEIAAHNTEIQFWSHPNLMVSRSAIRPVEASGNSVRIFFAAGFLLLLIHGISSAQCDGKPGPDGLTWDYDGGAKESFSLFKFIGNAFTPDLIKETRQIREYVRDARFGVLMKRCGDARAIDEIYLKALKIAEHNIARALFLSLMGTLEHRDVDLKVPIIGPIGVPLTFEADSMFNARFRNLPSRLYVDTPPEGDRDKLQHFFASAYIAYSSESRELARTGGNLVEWGEAQFVVGGVDDPRDRRSNKHGEQFGHDLLTVKNLLPSDYLNLPFQE